MIIIDNFSQVIAQIETERGINRDEIAEAIKGALEAAVRRNHTQETVLKSTLDVLTGEAFVYKVQTVVESPEDDEIEIALKEAKKIKKDIKLGEDLETDVTPSDFGRLAALTAKQVIGQRIREAEKNAVLAEFKDKVGTLVYGVVQKIEGDVYLIDLGSTEAMLMPREQIPTESFRLNERVHFYIYDVELHSRGPRVKISRAHPGLVRCLFELEVPEIQDGIIEIINVAREAGRRSKVAVKSNNPNVGAVGTCVGHMGGRIQTIIKEIGKEKIDILEYSEKPEEFIAASLKPAKISQVTIVDAEEKLADVYVENDQLSLAIGKSGSNVRLAVRLTGWRLDIKCLEGDNDAQDEGLSLSEKISKGIKEDAAKDELSVSETQVEAEEKNESEKQTQVESEEAQDGVVQAEDSKEALVDEGVDTDDAGQAKEEIAKEESQPEESLQEEGADAVEEKQEESVVSAEIDDNQGEEKAKA